ncbi:MAG TPA: GH116 family glycosyl hydrolase [Gemmataceae bacterium]|nr:GH116 family glycosyl hydrolase [Gemmataceae bacterium]
MKHPAEENALAETCTQPGCCDGPSRREFLGNVAISGAALAPGLSALAGPFETADFDKLVPADKKLHPEWLRSLVERGTPTVYRGAELENIGMPVGGLCAGQLYLGGDGRLWHWDIFNVPQASNFGDWQGPNYAHVPKPTYPIGQGFALHVTAEGKTSVRPLDRRGFSDIRFRGQYPIGFVEYRDAQLPVVVELQAYSPFIPLHVQDSSLPATVMHYTVQNTSDHPVEVELAGWLENAVCLGSGQNDAGTRRNRIVHEPELTLLHCTAESPPKKQPAEKRPDLLFEDFEKDSYEGWKVEGKAFGHAPVRRSAVFPYQGDLGGKGDRVVNSHASAPGNDVVQRDAQTGKLTSKSFTIERNYINFFIGGGAHPGKTCLNLVVNGKVARSATGRNENHMHGATFDVSALQGQHAVLEIVDAEKGPWGNIGIDDIVFSDVPRAPFILEKQADYGSLALALLGKAEGTFAFAWVPVKGSPAQAIFAGERHRAAQEAAEPFGRRLCGGLGRKWRLQPGEKAEAIFLITWYFPALPRGRFDRLTGSGSLQRSYAAHFGSAAEVSRHVARRFTELSGQTKLWHKTWYNSTLPYWLLDRTFLTICNLATAMAYQFTNGRFYAYEGTYCCDGTCTHVWHYAHAPARIFPQLERTTRDKVDFGIAFHADTGAMDYRAEYDRRVAHDGQAGTILRAYREHQMSPDENFLHRAWPKIRKSIEYLMAQDRNHEGLLEGEQYNTLDASWYGRIAWISSLYLACLRAGAAMAHEMGDRAFAQRCEALAARGSKQIVAHLYNGEYFIQLLDPKHLNSINTNDGCHIDQVFGQSWAFQVGLPRVIPAAETRVALESLWKYNFTPDVGPYRRGFKAIKAGRWYAMPGEGGLLMCTWPRGGAEKAPGKGGNPVFVGYFNECMTGFEYQVAAHMIWEGLVEKGLAITRMIHDRYHAAKRNPWNEVECSDHYARSMASYGVFLAACGFEYHGPRGHLAFAPRLTPDHFRAPFTAAEGWGTFTQKRENGRQSEELAVHWGRLRLRSLMFEVPADTRPNQVTVVLGDRTVAASHQVDGRQVKLALESELVIEPGSLLRITIE